MLYAVAAENYYRVLAASSANLAEEKAAMEEQVGAILKGWLVKGCGADRATAQIPHL